MYDLKGICIFNTYINNVKAAALSVAIRANPSTLIIKIKVRLGFYFLKRICVTFIFFFYLH